MGRQVRIEYPGAIYLLQSRSNGNEPIFQEVEDRHLFLEMLDRTCHKAQWELHAFRLEHSFFQIVLTTTQANLVTGMKWFLGGYTNDFNRRHKHIGHVFAGRYRSLVVDQTDPSYFISACHHAHRSQQPTGSELSPVQSPALPCWSSLDLYFSRESRNLKSFNYARLFDSLHLTDNSSGRNKLKDLALRWALNAPAEILKNLQRGWCLGSRNFCQDITAMLTRNNPELTSKTREFARIQAENIVQKELAKLGWTEDQLALSLKGDLEKVRIARLLREETTISLRWVAQRLNMGSWTHAANCIYGQSSKPKPGPEGHIRKKRRIERHTPKSNKKIPQPVKAVEDDRPQVQTIEELPVHCL